MPEFYQKHSGWSQLIMSNFRASPNLKELSQQCLSAIEVRIVVLLPQYELEVDDRGLPKVFYANKPCCGANKPCCGRSRRFRTGRSGRTREARHRALVGRTLAVINPPLGNAVCEVPPADSLRVRRAIGECEHFFIVRAAQLPNSGGSLAVD